MFYTLTHYHISLRLVLVLASSSSDGNSSIVTNTIPSLYSEQRESSFPKIKHEGSFSHNFLSITQKRQSWSSSGLKLHIPENSLMPYTPFCVLHIYSSTSRMFYFPQGHELVSAVYWIHSTPSCNFVKAFTMEIQYCAKPKLASKLSFVRSTTFHSGFLKLSTGIFKEGSMFGTLEIDTFSGYAITHDGPVERLYSVSLFYLGRTLQSWIIHLVVTWDTVAHREVSQLVQSHFHMML